MSDQSEAEVSRKSLWLLRAVTTGVALVVLGFIIHAAGGLFG